jgi:gliding motility-associated lipoprotein GldD
VCLFLLFFLLFPSCREEYTPKPYGYFRIDFPEKRYTLLDEPLPYRSAVATEARVVYDTSPEAEPYWIDIVYPDYKAVINISYKEIVSDTSLEVFLQDNHRLVYAHTGKAEAINEWPLVRKEEDTPVLGILYLIEGNAASPAQFFVTDSVRHFLRGSLYFESRPNKDSLAPVVEYLKKDIIELMESVRFESKKGSGLYRESITKKKQYLEAPVRR